jgi:hypothetical protein
VFQGFLSSSKRSSYVKDQWENDCNAQKGQVDIKINLVLITCKNGHQRDDGHEQCSVINGGYIELNNFIFNTLQDKVKRI